VPLLSLPVSLPLSPLALPTSPSWVLHRLSSPLLASWLLSWRSWPSSKSIIPRVGLRTQLL
jgi:hypothetical protein